MDKIEEQVRESFENSIQREIFVNHLIERMMKLGSPEDDYGDFHTFFNQICILNDTLDTDSEFIELKKIVNDCKTIYGEKTVQYLKKYMSVA